MLRDVDFTAEDGTTHRRVFHPAPQGAGPAIVMAHGFSGVKEQIEHCALAFAHAGFSVLLYDHRGFVASDGEPRQEIYPARQLSDCRDAHSGDLMALPRPCPQRQPHARNVSPQLAQRGDAALAQRVFPADLRRCRGVV
jgi:alpha-beta hydrolase superfamily lysophospholipase